MEFFTKCLLFLFFISSSYGRSVTFETNEFNSSEVEEDSSIECDCELRYYQHYLAKNCIAESEDACGCPTGFICPATSEISQPPAKVCTYNGKEYHVGSKIITSNSCQVCRCRDGVPPYIDCLPRECPPSEHALGPNCHLIFKENKCCPVGHECIQFQMEDEVPSNKSKVCEYNGEFYPLGSKIYPVDDPCLECLCNENWNGVDNTSCHQQECLFEKHKSKLDAGCIPVYHEKRCCPIEFYCPSSHNITFSRVTGNDTVERLEEDGKPCLFSDVSYELGAELPIDNLCVRCKCLVPPDFTCVHQSCPPPPNAENCLPYYNPNDCCPSYDCLYGDSEPTAESEGCPTPLCADSSCRIEVPEGHQCPTCVCEDRTSFSEGNFIQQTQQVEQISQNFEPLQNIEGYGDSDYNEEELQMLPIRIQDSEGQFSVMEKIILPDSENSQELMDDLLEENFKEVPEDSSTELELFANTNPEGAIDESVNSTASSERESESTEADPGSATTETPKSILKRSEVTDFAENGFDRATEPYDANAEIEREGSMGSLEGNMEFDPELDSLDKGLDVPDNESVEANNDEMENSGTDITESQAVPPGCPTPMCANKTCRIVIPPNERCPTCICKRKLPYYIQP